jgi:hypothetical protein
VVGHNFVIRATFDILVGKDFGLLDFFESSRHYLKLIDGNKISSKSLIGMCKYPPLAVEFVAEPVKTFIQALTSDH